MIDLKKDIQDVVDSKSTKEGAKYKIKLQPYFRTLPEVFREFTEFTNKFKNAIQNHMSV